MAIELAPQQCLYWSNLGDALHQLPNREEEARDADEWALDFCDRELEVNPGNHDALLIKSKLLARSGRIEAALDVVEAYELLNSQDPLDKLYLALVFVRCGDMQAVKNTLEQAVQQGYPRILILAEPEFVPVRDEAWFKALVYENQSNN